MSEESDNKQKLVERYEAFSHGMYEVQQALFRNDFTELSASVPQPVRELLRLGVVAVQEPIKENGLVNEVHHSYAKRLALLGFIAQPHETPPVLKESTEVLREAQMALTLAAVAGSLSNDENRDVAFLYVTRKVEETGIYLSGINAFINRQSPTWLYYIYARRMLDRKFAVDDSRKLDEATILDNMVTAYNDIFSLQRPENHP